MVTRVRGVPDVASDARARLGGSEDVSGLGGAIRDVLVDSSHAMAHAAAARAWLDRGSVLTPRLEQHERIYRAVIGRHA